MTPLCAYLTRTMVKQADFAERLGITQSTVSKLVGGTAKPSLDLAVAIERLTQGAVPAASWVPDAPTAEPQEDAA